MYRQTTLIELMLELETVAPPEEVLRTELGAGSKRHGVHGFMRNLFSFK